MHQNGTILEALRKINYCLDSRVYTVFVIDDDGKVIGSLTDGDVRRAIINGSSVTDSVKSIVHEDFHYLLDPNDYKKIKEFRSQDIKLIPLVDKDMKFIDCINLNNIRAILPLDVVIMAGGKGVRLRPYTDNIPKPMLDLGGTSIIAHNIDRLIKYGAKNFYISVNYMKNSIQEYLNSRYQNHGLNIMYIEESKPLGTVGSIKLIKKFDHQDVLIMNADILTNINFDDFFYHYKETKDDMCVATFNVKMDVPYAVLNIKDKKVVSFTEKPTYMYQSNAGIYLISKENVSLIPDNQPFDATDLITAMINNNKTIGYFPIMGYWMDIGTLSNYSKAKDDIKYVRF
jgi:dTDP-glucose pyrophosphorylase